MGITHTKKQLLNRDSCFLLSNVCYYTIYRVIGQNVLVLPYNPNFILWTLASLCLSSELVYIYLASHPISIYVVVLRSISVFGGIKRGIINPDRA